MKPYRCLTVGVMHAAPPTRRLSPDDRGDPLSPAGPSASHSELHLAGARHRAAVSGAAAVPPLLGTESRWQAALGESGASRADCATQASLHRDLVQPALSAIGTGKKIGRCPS